ncbi:MAG: hypothetical protein WAW42_04470 [Candidatus Competibacteraceae bacterium]
MKIRHALLALFAILAIAFMQPLVTFLGGLTLLLGAGALIFRDLPPTSQDAIEHRVLGWLRQARVNATPEVERATVRRRRPPVVAKEPGSPLVLTPSRGEER